MSTIYIHALTVARDKNGNHMLDSLLFGACHHNSELGHEESFYIYMSSILLLLRNMFGHLTGACHPIRMMVHVDFVFFCWVLEFSDFKSKIKNVR